MLLIICLFCEGDLCKVFSVVGVVFKGLGFYFIDNYIKGVLKVVIGDSFLLMVLEFLMKFELVLFLFFLMVKVFESVF